jgi:hypothetical protein
MFNDFEEYCKIFEQTKKGNYIGFATILKNYSYICTLKKCLLFVETGTGIRATINIPSPNALFIHIIRIDMKRILLLSTLFVVGITTSSFAQSNNNNHVLVEEFNSTNCPPCAGTDPAIEYFEQQQLGEVCVLKWHQNFPEQNEDPFYNTQTQERFNYYGLSGAPSLTMQGQNNIFDQYLFSSPYPIIDSETAYLNKMGNYYQMSVKHSVVGDSVIVMVTVITGATQPTATDLNLGVVLSQRFQQFLGANRRPMYTDIVLTAIPQLQSSGAINNPFSQAASSTVTYRYATKVVSSWDLTQLVAVAFIQSVGGAGKPVYQSAWDVPQVNIYADGFNFDPAPVLAGNANSSANYFLTNNTSTSQTIKIASSLTSAGNYSLNIAGITSLADSTITIAAGGSDTVTASVNASGPALTTPAYIVKFSTLDSIGIGGGSEVAFGQNIPNAVVNGTTETIKSELSGLESSLTNSGFGVIGPITLQAWEELFGLGAPNDWSQFKTVWYDDQYNYGIQYLSDTSLITTFLNNGGNFAMSAPAFPYFFSVQFPGEGAVGTDQWMNNVFHIENLNFAQGGYSSVEGVASDPIGNAVTGHISISAPIYTQTMYPIDDSAHGVYIDPSGDSVGFRATSNGGKVFYSSFDLGGIAATKRDAMVKAVMDWFYPAAGVNDASTASCSLDPVYPNPIDKAATISYMIPDHRFVTLVVQDMLGRTIATLVNQEEDAGHFTAPFDASHLANGTYICTLTAGDFKTSGKITVDR